ncbi:MAG: S1/P1 nuclease, partial [Acidobacteriota bacterium]
PQRVIGHGAAQHLTPSARAAVDALLEGQSLAQVGSWADEIRSDPSWQHANSWHYVNVPPGERYGETPPNPDGDVIEAILRFDRVLRSSAATRNDRVEALKFIVHFVGDLHQPMHTGPAATRGGNDTPVYWFDRLTNLHRVWDTDLFEHEKLSYTEYADFLRRPSADEVRDWQADDVIAWFEEANALLTRAHDFGPSPAAGGETDALGDPADDDPALQAPRLSWSYAYRNVPIVRECLLRAGVRLAGLLNRAFPMPPEADPTGAAAPRDVEPTP